MGGDKVETRTIAQQVIRTHLAGGTGIITTMDGEEIYILSSTLRQQGDNYLAKTETGVWVDIPISSIAKAEPS